MGVRAADVRHVLIVGVNEEGREVRRKLESNRDYGLRAGRVPSGRRGRRPKGEEDAPVFGELADLRRIVAERVVDEVVFALPFSQAPRLRRADLLVRGDRHDGPSEGRFRQDAPVADLPFGPRRDADAHDLQHAARSGISGGEAGPRHRCLHDGPGGPRTGPAGLCGPGQGDVSEGRRSSGSDRVGQSGRIFTLLKFRSMYADAEDRKKELASFNEMSGPVFKMKNDPRVTPVGRWLRKFSLDELPQLWNVLVGDLSLVGPRPPTPDEVLRYERWHRRRLSVKPGVTCLWQVSGRNAIDFADWMRLDLTYIDNWSLKLDLKILLRTIPAVLFARGSR